MSIATRDAAIARTGWGNPVHLWQPRNACFWVYVLGVAYGLWQLIVTVNQSIRVYAPALTASAVIFSLYAVLFWWFTTRIDRYSRQPVPLIVAAFVWGGVAATFALAISANTALIDLYGKLFGADFQAGFGAGLAAPFVEETSKGAAVLLLLFLFPQVVRTAYDGFILGAFAGLGFEIFEDITYALNSATEQFGSDQLGTSLGTVFLRLLTGFSSHILYSAVFGAGLVYLIGTVAQRRRAGLGLTLMLSAMLLHGLWDANVGLAGGSVTGVYALMLIEIAVSFALVVRVFHQTVRPEREAMRAVLAPEVPAGVITEAELDALAGGLRERRAYRRAARDRADRRARHHRLEAAHDLADQLALSGGAETARVQFARAEVARLRG